MDDNRRRTRKKADDDSPTKPASTKKTPSAYTVRPPAGWLYHPVASMARFLLFLLFGLRKPRRNPLSDISGPLILIGNHPSFLDPAVMSTVIWPRKVNFVATRSVFRNPLVRAFMTRMGVIPKMQFRSDLAALKNMLRVLRAGGVLGLYPEGQRSCDGLLQPIAPAIAKLIQKANVAVGAVIEHGAYLAWPRWSADGIRTGKVEVETKILLQAGEAAALSADQIMRLVENGLAYDDYQWHRESRKTGRKGYRSRRPAESLDLVCHRCPACHRDRSIASDRDRLICSVCGYQRVADRHGLIDAAVWHREQLHAWSERIRENGAHFVFNAEVDRLNEASGVIETLGRGVITVDEATLVFRTDDTEPGEERLRLSLGGNGSFAYDLGSSLEWAADEWTCRIRPDHRQIPIELADYIRVLRLDKPLDSADNGR